MEQKNKQSNIIIVGTGGQGLITLLKIVSEAAFFQGYDVKTSELHGLSQRGGSVGVHIRMGKKIYSPLIAKGKANIVIALETQEALKGVYFANKETVFLINKNIVPIPLKRSFSVKEIVNIIKKNSDKIFLIPASETCREKLGKDVVAGIYLLALASLKEFIPLTPESILKGIERIVPKRYFKLNKEAFTLAKKDEEKIF